jgi:hypothetical protein
MENRRIGMPLVVVAAAVATAVVVVVVAVVVMSTLLLHNLYNVYTVCMQVSSLHAIFYRMVSGHQKSKKAHMSTYPEGLP